MFDRVISFVGLENYEKIKNTTVLVVGLGGVGGYACEALARTGISNIILIDFDKIDESNINRQVIATNKNIGKYKVDEFTNRIHMINPSCNVYKHNIFLDNNTINILNGYKIDYIVDCCDTVNAKKLLIDYSIKKDIKLISSMGTAKKLDSTKLVVTDIRKTSYDPLAKIIRRYIKDIKTNKKIMVVSSTESPIKSDILPSLIFVPAQAGLLCANYVIKDILETN